MPVSQPKSPPAPKPASQAELAKGMTQNEFIADILKGLQGNPVARLGSTRAQTTAQANQLGTDSADFGGVFDEGTPRADVKALLDSLGRSDITKDAVLLSQNSLSTRDPTNAIHEFTHAGLAELRDKIALLPEGIQKALLALPEFQGLFKEENLVRALTQAGAPQLPEANNDLRSSQMRKTGVEQRSGLGVGLFGPSDDTQTTNEAAEALLKLEGRPPKPSKAKKPLAKSPNLEEILF